MNYSDYYYRPNRKKSKAKSGLGARIAVVCCIAASFGLFILIYAFSHPAATFISMDAARGEIKVSGGSVYALEMGSYATKTAADSAAQVVRNRGGAGYVRQTGDSYRVVAAVYAKKSDCDSVAASLTAAGETCARTEWSISACAVKVGTEKKNLETCCGALTALYENFTQLEDVWRKLDGGASSQSEAAGCVQALKEKMEAAASALDPAEGEVSAAVLTAVQAENTRLAGAVSAVELKFWAAAGADAFIRLLSEIS